MGQRYIKDRKTGQFRGSVSDGKNIPTATSSLLPQVPAAYAKTGSFTTAAPNVPASPYAEQLESFRAQQKTNASVDPGVQNRINELTAEVEALIDSGKIEQHLNHMKAHANRFGPVSLAILNRRFHPDEDVSPASKWRKVGREIKPGEKPTYVLTSEGLKAIYGYNQTQPLNKTFHTAEEAKAFHSQWTAKGYTVHTERTSTGFSSTIAAPPDTGFALLEGSAPEDLHNSVLRRIAAEGISVEYKDFEDDRNGEILNDYNGTGAKGITIRADNSPAQQTKTLIHELAHHRLQHGGKVFSDHAHADHEIAAESLTFMISREFGFDTKTYSVPYVTEWAKGDKKRIREIINRDVLPVFSGLVKDLKR